jgi:predicted nucleic acid-binding protein
MYCFDTNIVMDIFRGDKDLQNRLEKVQNLGAEVSITMITLCELYKGVYQSGRRDEALKLVDDFVKSTVVLSHTQKSCQLFGFDCFALREKGKPTQEIDLMIGCIAKAEGKILVTRTEKHFRNIPDLNVEVW